MHSLIAQYIDRVLGVADLRDPEREQAIRAELADHLQEKSAALEGQGVPTAEAVQQAIAAHGHPVVIGYKLRKPRWVDIRSRGTACGFIAVGRNAIGVVAIGQWSAAGIIAVGHASVGVFAVGMFAAGVVSAGGYAVGLLLAIGAAALGAFAYGSIAAAGIIPAGATTELFGQLKFSLGQKIMNSLDLAWLADSADIAFLLLPHHATQLLRLSIVLGLLLYTFGIIAFLPLLRALERKRIGHIIPAWQLKQHDEAENNLHRRWLPPLLRSFRE